MGWRGLGHACRPLSIDGPRYRLLLPSPDTLPSSPLPLLQASLGNLLLFGRLDKAAQARIAESTWERPVAAGEILIQEGEVGLAATELYVVKSGKFEVGEGAGGEAGAGGWGRRGTV
jgi:CRP-like cAMP-binding protein